MIMKRQCPEQMMQEICHVMGMIPSENNPMGCGVYLKGDGKTTQGFFWYLIHEDHFVLTKSDFIFCRDTLLTMPGSSFYLSLRLDYARHLPPGKILAFMEEKGHHTNTIMDKGTRVAYTEVMYMPPFYKKHLETAFTAVGDSPLELLKNMGGEHNWSSAMMSVLSDIYKSNLTSLAAELFYVAKSYELMAELVAMGNTRLPKKVADYEDILRVLQYIDENYTGTIKQTELVKLSHMSSTKLKNLFRRFTGCTITGYILGKKADHAAHLLADSEMSVEQIAKAVGFDTATGFATSFKKQTGYSPSKYRKQIIFNCLKNPSEIENFCRENLAGK